MRPALLLALLLSTTTAALATQPEPVDAKQTTDKFPIPKDATGGESQPGGGGKILLYKVARGRDAVVAEVKASLKSGGWTLVKDDSSPSGRAIRLEVKKNAKVYKVSFTGDDTRAAIILTLP
jgi:hypothetical protein